MLKLSNSCAVPGVSLECHEKGTRSGLNTSLDRRVAASGTAPATLGLDLGCLGTVRVTLLLDLDNGREVVVLLVRTSVYVQDNV